MPKSIVIDPEKVFCQRRHPFLRYPGQRLPEDRRGGTRGLFPRGLPEHLAGHVRHPGVRDDPQRDQDQGRLQGHRLQPRRAGAPLHRPGSRRGGHGLRADARRPHLRLAPQPRRDPGQGLLRHPPAERRASCWRSWSPTATAPCFAPVEKGLQRNGAGPGAAVLRLRRLQRDLRARDRLQPRAGRLHARVLHALRHLSEQRHRGRLGLHRAGRGALQARQPQARHRGVPTSATPPSAAARCGKASPSPPWTSTASCGTSRWAAACRSSSTA